jgi:hypothetical protein
MESSARMPAARRGSGTGWPALARTPMAAMAVSESGRGGPARPWLVARRPDHAGGRGPSLGLASVQVRCQARRPSRGPSTRGPRRSTPAAAAAAAAAAASRRHPVTASPGTCSGPLFQCPALFATCQWPPAEGGLGMLLLCGLSLCQCGSVSGRALTGNEVRRHRLEWAQSTPYSG